MNATSSDQNESTVEQTANPAAGLEAEYARVELMGHRQRVGQIQEVTRFGAALLRVDFYDSETDALATEFYGGSSIYCLSPCSKAVVDAWVERHKSYRQPAIRHLPAPEDNDPDDDFDDNGHRLDEDNSAF